MAFQRIPSRAFNPFFNASGTGPPASTGYQAALIIGAGGTNNIIGQPGNATAWGYVGGAPSLLINAEAFFGASVGAETPGAIIDIVFTFADNPVSVTLGTYTVSIGWHNVNLGPFKDTFVVPVLGPRMQVTVNNNEGSSAILDPLIISQSNHEGLVTAMSLPIGTLGSGIGTMIGAGNISGNVAAGASQNWYGRSWYGPATLYVLPQNTPVFEMSWQVQGWDDASGGAAAGTPGNLIGQWTQADGTQFPVNLHGPSIWTVYNPYPSAQNVLLWLVPDVRGLA